MFETRRKASVFSAAVICWCCPSALLHQWPLDWGHFLSPPRQSFKGWWHHNNEGHPDPKVPTNVSFFFSGTWSIRCVLSSESLCAGSSGSFGSIYSSQHPKKRPRVCQEQVSVWAQWDDDPDWNETGGSVSLFVVKTTCQRPHSRTALICREPIVSCLFSSMMVHTEDSTTHCPTFSCHHVTTSLLLFAPLKKNKDNMTF